MSNFKAVIFKGPNQVKNDGSANIKIRVTHNRKADYIATDLYVLVKSFDSKTGKVKSGNNKDYINLRITDYIQKYQKLDIELGDRRKNMTAKQVKSYLLDEKLSTNQINFFSFAEEFLENINAEGTRRWHESTISNLRNFTNDSLMFSDINLDFLNRFESFLKRQGVGAGINNYMRSFRAIFNKARDKYNDEDSGQIRIPHYPFRKYKIPKTSSKSKKHFLSAGEIGKLMQFQPDTAGEEIAKDMFMLMFYFIGIEVKDLFHLRTVKKGRIYYDRFKTGKDFSIKIEPEAEAILKKYKSKTSLFSFQEKYANHRNFMKYLNIQLHGSNTKTKKVKGVFPKLQIDKPVTTKWARHTWATIARNNCRINKDDVALCLGHSDSDNRVTDIYIDYDYSIIDDSNRKVIDFVNSKFSTGLN